MDNLSKLKSMKPGAGQALPERSLVTKELLADSTGNSLPLVVKPRFKGVSLTDWIGSNKGEFDADLLKYGALLLRGFGIEHLEDFGQFVASFKSEPLTYMFRSSPRHELDKAVKNVYNSTTYPREERINLHNESSYSRSWGMKIIFCCLVVADEGGETPLADSRKVLADVPPGIVAKFRARGVMYRRKLIRDMGMSWQEVFQTDDKAVVDHVCKLNNIRYKFVSDNYLEIEWVKKAVYHHPASGEETWFNHVFFFNKYARYQELGLELEEAAPSGLIHSDTLYGDGTAIGVDEYLAIKEAYRKNTVALPYQQGDILFLDNMLVAHGRNPYKGSRTVATAIIEPASDL